MTESGPSRPVPGPPRPAPPGGQRFAATSADAHPGNQPATERTVQPEDPFAGLDERPVPEHVAVFEAEHARLERELGTIDQL